MLRCARARVGGDAGAVARATRRRRGTTRMVTTRATTTTTTTTTTRARRNRTDDDAAVTETMTTTRARGSERTTRRATDALALSAAALAATNAGAASAAQLVSELALDPEGAKTASAVLGPLFALSTILFIVRIVMTWYPSVPYTKLPWVLAYAPTEPLLKPTRALVPPVGGVDVSPIIWVGMISFMNEILLGKQGLLVLLANKQLGG
jgi:YggT family protein